jgi:hypothetical protein
MPLIMSRRVEVRRMSMILAIWRVLGSQDARWDVARVQLR